MQVTAPTGQVREKFVYPTRSDFTFVIPARKQKWKKDKKTVQQNEARYGTFSPEFH